MEITISVESDRPTRMSDGAGVFMRNSRMLHAS